jgi:hypothetical protein
MERPRISEETLYEHLDWLGQQDPNAQLGTAKLDHLVKVAELAVRVQGNKAQAKATQHTLVEDGLIAPPPHAS